MKRSYTLTASALSLILTGCSSSKDNTQPKRKFPSANKLKQILQTDMGLSDIEVKSITGPRTVKYIVYEKGDPIVHISFDDEAGRGKADASVASLKAGFTTTAISKLSCNFHEGTFSFRAPKAITVLRASITPN